MSSGERCARVGELELCYEAFGADTLSPLLLVMGLASQMVLWDDEFCHALAARGFWVIRFDNRDVGRSTILRGRPVPTRPVIYSGAIAGPNRMRLLTWPPMVAGLDHVEHRRSPRRPHRPGSAGEHREPRGGGPRRRLGALTALADPAGFSFLFSPARTSAVATCSAPASRVYSQPATSAQAQPSAAPPPSAREPGRYSSFTPT